MMHVQRIKLFKSGGDEKVMLQSPWQTDDAWASFLERGLKYIKQAVHVMPLLHVNKVTICVVLTASPTVL